MAQEKPNPVGEWVHLARRNAPVVRAHFGEWIAAAREEPRLVWETPAIRYTIYGIGGILVAWLLTYAIGLFVPPPPASAKPEATTADFHVVCASPACAHHFQINRPFGFSKFPVQCPSCKQATGVSARRCSSQSCGNRWVAPVQKDGTLVCSRCGGPL